MKNKKIIQPAIKYICFAVMTFVIATTLYGCSQSADNYTQAAIDSTVNDTTALEYSTDAPKIIFESDYEAQKAVYNAVQLPMESSVYTEESLTVYLELSHEVNLAMSDINTMNASEWIDKINTVIESLDYKKGFLPTIYITNEDGTVHSSSYHNAAITYISDAGLTYSDKNASIKLRGNSTRDAEKPPFTIKLSEKYAFQGMDAGRKWILLAEAFDKTMMRNKLAYDFAQQLRMDFVSQCEYVDLYVDSKYYGVYLLTEAVTDGKTRVDIDVQKGDCLIELESERNSEDETYIISPNGVRFKINKPEEPDSETVENIKEKIASIEEAINSADIALYSSVVDIDSFVDFYIFKEYFKDVDAYYSSTRFYIKNGVLYAGPPWDNDLSCGNASYQIQEVKYKSYCNYKPYGTGSFDSADGEWNDFGWFAMLWADDNFKALVRKRWDELRPNIINVYEENELGPSMIDRLIDEYGDDFNRNYTVWDINKHYGIYENQQNGVFDDHVAFLRQWLKKRVAVIDELFVIE